jgi:hypothetical protein
VDTRRHLDQESSRQILSDDPHQNGFDKHWWVSWSRSYRGHDPSLQDVEHGIHGAVQLSALMKRRLQLYSWINNRKHPFKQTLRGGLILNVRIATIRSMVPLDKNPDGTGGFKWLIKIGR